MPQFDRFEITGPTSLLIGSIGYGTAARDKRSMRAYCDWRNGNFGDVKAVGDGLSELRVHAGPGYRVYFTQHGYRVVVLLCGGDKSNQSKDIALAKRIAGRFKET